MALGEVYLQLQAVKVCKTRLELKTTCYGYLRQSKSGYTPKEMTDKQNFIQDKFNFFKTQIRHKGFKSSAHGASASVASSHNISSGLTDMASMEISMRSDATIQLSVMSPSALSGISLCDHQVLDQFAQMQIMLSTSLGRRHCNQAIETAANFLHRYRLLTFTLTPTKHFNPP